VALDETRRFADEGPNAEELDLTKNYLCGLHPLSLETHDQLAERLADLELHGLPHSEIASFRPKVRSVTGAACVEIARRHFPLDRAFIVAVGPGKAIAKQLDKYGPVAIVPAKRMV
jgi:zinc protease